MWIERIGTVNKINYMAAERTPIGATCKTTPFYRDGLAVASIAHSQEELLHLQYRLAEMPERDTGLAVGKSCHCQSGLACTSSAASSQGE